MSTTAIVMMIVSIVMIWGGLALAIFNLNHSNAEMPDRSEVRRDL